MFWALSATSWTFFSCLDGYICCFDHVFQRSSLGPNRIEGTGTCLPCHIPGVQFEVFHCFIESARNEFCECTRHLIASSDVDAGLIGGMIRRRWDTWWSARVVWLRYVGLATNACRPKNTDLLLDLQHMGLEVPHIFFFGLVELP